MNQVRHGDGRDRHRSRGKASKQNQTEKYYNGKGKKGQGKGWHHRGHHTASASSSGVDQRQRQQTLDDTCLGSGVFLFSKCGVVCSLIAETWQQSSTTPVIQDHGEERRQHQEPHQHDEQMKDAQQSHRELCSLVLILGTASLRLSCVF